MARVGAALAARVAVAAVELAALGLTKMPLPTVAVEEAVRVALQVPREVAWADSLGRLLPTPCL